jgi:mannonate dehydratase
MDRSGLNGDCAMTIFEHTDRPQESDLTRRDLARFALGGAALLSSTPTSSAKVMTIPPGVKIAAQLRNPTEENFVYLKQLGVTWLSIADPTPETSTPEGFTRIRKQWEAGGFRVYNESSRVAPNGNAVLNVPEIVLNLPGRDERIEEYLNYLRYLGQAGIPYMTLGFEGLGNWRSGQTTLPRGYVASDCDLSSPTFQGGWNGKVYRHPAGIGRVFTTDEIWDNYTYFIRKVVPVAEEAGVRIGIHPDDPPEPILGGVPRIFTSFEGYRRALEIANSPNVGMCLCVGSWLEGGPRMGKTPVEVIRYFGPRKKLFKIHFRNVTAPLPHFTETLMDDGYYDMYKVMEALVDVNFDGIVIPDHIPALGIVPGSPAASGRERPGLSPGLAYSIGYLNATLKAALSNRRKT